MYRAISPNVLYLDFKTYVLRVDIDGCIRSARVDESGGVQFLRIML